MATKITAKKTSTTKKVEAKKEVKKEDQIIAEQPDEKVASEQPQTITVQVDSEQIAQAVADAVKSNNVVNSQKDEKEYREEDLILCRSITGGELILIGAKSGVRYTFADRDDTCEIEVRDLNSLRASKSMYLYKPLFVIDDEDFVNQPRYKEIKALYDEIRSNDIDTVLNMSLAEFKRILPTLPNGYKDAIVDEAATRIHNDEFDSLGKIKAIDDICGTDLFCLIK